MREGDEGTGWNPKIISPTFSKNLAEGEKKACTGGKEQWSVNQTKEARNKITLGEKGLWRNARCK